jgi:hypothetical protein
MKISKRSIKIGQTHRAPAAASLQTLKEIRNKGPNARAAASCQHCNMKLQGPRLVLPKLLKNTLCKKKIPCHVKLAIHVWSNKCK